MIMYVFSMHPEPRPSGRKPQTLATKAFLPDEVIQFGAIMYVFLEKMLFKNFYFRPDNVRFLNFS